MKPYDIQDRSFAFACRGVALAERLATHGPVARRIAAQLVAAGTSIGANLEEATAGQSKADFIAKCCVSLKEAREARYWLRLAVACYGTRCSEGASLAEEATELIAIITCIVKNARSTARRG